MRELRIKEIYAKNFRTLKDIKILLDADYCTLSGKNNAGKSAVVRIIEHFLEDEDRVFYREERAVRYSRDTTQWEEGPIEIALEIALHRDDDAELYFFVGKFSNERLSSEVVTITLTSRLDATSSKSSVLVDGVELDEMSSAEVLKKFRTAPNLIVHNSTKPRARYYYSGDEMVEIIESQFSDDDNKKIAAAQGTLQSRVRAAAKKHKEALGEYLGRLNERYSIELSPPDRSQSANVPLSVTLTDRSVQVPLLEWGTGTQNRTKALISVFGAARAREAAAPSDRVTAVVIIEEPESFLHPSAQAEFGKVLNQLSTEASIQIIATTHSPYMLNQTRPEANILLERRMYRGLLRETQVVDTAGNSWMRPFSENLGVVPEDFDALADIFKRDAGRVVLVEGAIDVDYFHCIRDKYNHIYQLPADIEVVAYGGKDTLKNTALLKFVLARFDSFFVTFDLDAERDCETALQRLSLIKGDDFCAIGIQKSGQQCIEGLLPERVKSAVFSRYHEDVMALQADGSERKRAKEALKKKMLDEFRKSELTDDELKDFRALMKRIARKFQTKR